jgi:hypothetical protein
LTKESFVTTDYVDALPRNAAGNVLKKWLRAPFWEDVGAP